MDFLGSDRRERGDFRGGASRRIRFRRGGAGADPHRFRGRFDGGRPLGRDVSTPRKRQMPGREVEADPPRQERDRTHPARPVQLARRGRDARRGPAWICSSGLSASTIGSRSSSEDKKRIPFPGPAFDARYKALVEDLVRNAIAKGGSILVLGLPVMLDADANADATAKNRAVRRRRQPRSARRAPSTRRRGPRASAPDEYKPFLPNAKNAMIQVRATDGVHFTTAGYDMVLDTFYPAILASLKQRGRDLEQRVPQPAWGEVRGCAIHWRSSLGR